MEGPAPTWLHRHPARALAWLVVVGWLAAGVPAVALAEDTPPPAAAPAPTPAEPSTEHLQQLELCRTGIVDADARPEERRRWAAQLLTYSSPQAQELVVSLLQPGTPAPAQAALCGALAERNRANGEGLDARLLDPLLELLAAEDAGLRSAAAQALAGFNGPAVTDRLGGLAAQADRPLHQRLAAIDALTGRLYDREAATQLVALLDAQPREVVERSIAALASLVHTPLGNDPQRYRDWWQQQAKLSDGDWLRDQVRVQRDRQQALLDQQQALRVQAEAEARRRVQRIADLQRELFRSLPADQQSARLQQWLQDPLPEVKRTALTVISTRIVDEGYRPDEPVRTALLALLNDPSDALRSEVLTLLPHVPDPAVSQALVARLGQEQRLEVRVALYAALGKLASPEAIPAIIQELTKADSPREVVREAALALGQIAERLHADHPVEPGKCPEPLMPAVAPLKQRYAAVPADDVRLRGALLSAMAGVADGSFTDEFVSALDAEDPALQRPALQGITALRHRAKLPRCRGLAGSADPRVRMAAALALAALGHDDDDLEALLTRLRPGTEQDPAIFETAWTAWLRILERRPVADRLVWAERLRGLNGLELRCLRALERRASGNTGSADHDAVRDRLSRVLVDGGQFDEAATILRDLYGSLTARSDPAAFDAGVRWLEASLRHSTPTAVAGTIDQLAAVAADDAARARIVAAVAAYADADAVAGNRERSAALLGQLQAVTYQTWGPEWGALLQRVTARAAPPTPPPPPAEATPG